MAYNRAVACPDAEELARFEMLSDDVRAHAATCEECAGIIDVLRACDEPTSTAQAAGNAETVMPPAAGAGAVLLDVHDPAPGETIGRYVLVGRLGTGGMGVVMAAYDPRLDRTVALKFIRADRTSDTMVRRLEREAQALAKLSHPNLVRVYDAGVDRGRVYLAMEWIDGVTLRAWLADARRSTPRSFACFARLQPGCLRSTP